MFAVLITLTPGHWNKFIECQKANVQIAELPSMDVKTRWNSTVELLECAYQFLEFTCEWHKNPKFSDYRPLFTTQDAWTFLKYVMEVLRLFQYWTLWMSKRHTITLHHIITVYNDMCDDMDGMMQTMAKKKTQSKEDIFFAVQFAWQNLSKYYTEVTPTAGVILLSAHMLDPFWMLRSFRNCDKATDIKPEDETSYTTQYTEALLMYVENKYCAKHKCLPVTKPKNIPNNNLMFSTMPSRSAQSCYDQYDLCSDDEEYLMPNNVAETTPRWSDRAAHLLSATRLYLNSPPGLPQNWGQIHPDLDDYHSDPM